MIVKEINPKDTHDFILNKHYAQRLPSISYAYGLFIDDVLCGICTIGKPASPHLCKGICGEEYKNIVWELNRLCVKDGLPKNTLSMFLSRVLKLLKHESMILVSYADSGAGHTGYIYQATNWLYTGKTKERTDRYVSGGKHSRHYDKDEPQKFRKIRSSKHRYVYFLGKNKKDYIKNLKYPILQYPKDANTNYILGEKIKEKIIELSTGNILYE